MKQKQIFPCAKEIKTVCCLSQRTDVKLIKIETDMSSQTSQRKDKSERNKQSENDTTERESSNREQCQWQNRAKDRRTNDTLGDLFSNLLDIENGLGNVSRLQNSISFILIQPNMMIKKKKEGRCIYIFSFNEMYFYVQIQ